MEDILRAVFGDLPQFLVNFPLFPFLQNLRLELGKVGFHGKGGLGQIQGILIVHLFLETRDSCSFFLGSKRRNSS
jgi:hypothetical protein